MLFGGSPTGPPKATQEECRDILHIDIPRATLSTLSEKHHNDFSVLHAAVHIGSILAQVVLA